MAFPFSYLYLNKVQGLHNFLNFFSLNLAKNVYQNWYTKECNGYQ